MRIDVNQLPPSSSSPNARVSWPVKYREAKVYGDAVYYECVKVRNSLAHGGDFRPFRRPVIDLTFVFPSNRRRDEDNLRATFKPGQDMLVQAGLFDGDDMEHLVVNRPKILVDPARAPLTIIEIQENSCATKKWTPVSRKDSAYPSSRSPSGKVIKF